MNVREVQSACVVQEARPVAPAESKVRVGEGSEEQKEQDEWQKKGWNE